MRVSLLALACATTLLVLTDLAQAENQLRFVANRSRTTLRTTSYQPTPAAAAPVPADEAAPIVDSAYVEGGVGGTPGWPIGGGLRHVTAWPPMPDCCNPWVGYCDEYRCNGCQGRPCHRGCRGGECCDDSAASGDCGSAACAPCRAKSARHFDTFAIFKHRCGGCSACSTGCQDGCCVQTTNPTYCPLAWRGDKRGCASSGSASNSCVAGSAPSGESDGEAEATSEPSAPKNQLPKKKPSPTVTGALQRKIAKR